jgi:hypothetical protein
MNVKRFQIDGSRDWTYSEGCGCKITFFANAEFKSSRMLPGPNCTDHTGRYQVAERDCLMERAKESLEQAKRGELKS